jgi:hypothetical protein
MYKPTTYAPQWDWFQKADGSIIPVRKGTTPPPDAKPYRELIPEQELLTQFFGDKTTSVGTTEEVSPTSEQIPTRTYGEEELGRARKLLGLGGQPKSQLVGKPDFSESLRGIKELSQTPLTEREKAIIYLQKNKKEVTDETIQKAIEWLRENPTGEHVPTEEEIAQARKLLGIGWAK